MIPYYSYIKYSLLYSFHSSEPESLVSLQKTHWLPLLDWANTTFRVEISTATDSFLIPPHPESTIKKFDEVLSKFDPWEMAGTFATANSPPHGSHEFEPSHGTGNVQLQVVPHRASFDVASYYGRGSFFSIACRSQQSDREMG